MATVALVTGVIVSAGARGQAPTDAPGQAARQGELAGVLVASEGNDSVLALDPRTLRARRVVALGPYGGEKLPHQIVLSGDGQSMFVTEYGYGALAVYDARTGAQEAEIPVGSGPHGLALSPDGRFAYVAASQSKWLAVVDLAAGAVVAQVPTQLLPWDVIVTPDGTRAWVTTQGGQTIMEIDLETRREVRSIELGESYVIAAGLLPDGRLVAGGHASNRLFVIDPSTGEVVSRPSLPGAPPEVQGLEGAGPYYCQVSFSGGAMPVAMAVRPGHDELVVATHGTNELVVLALPDLTVRRQFAVGGDPQSVAVSADGRVAYVTSGGSGQLWRVDLDTGDTTKADVGSRPIGVAQT